MHTEKERAPGIGHTFGVRVDGAAPRGLWPPAGGGLCRRVVKGTVLKIDWPFRARGFLSLTALRAEGCGIALTGDEYKVSVTDLLSVSYGMICILVISRCAAPPYPAAPDFPPKGETTHYDLCVAGAPSNHVRCASTGKRVTRFARSRRRLRIK